MKADSSPHAPARSFLPERLAALLKTLLRVSPACLLALAAITWFALPRLHSSNPRVVYGTHHLPAALLYCAAAAVVAVLAMRWWDRHESLGGTRIQILTIVAVFAITWLPVISTGQFVQDDWMLLSGATVRQSLFHHPLQSWNALDTVDGNFRPLGTILFVNLALHLAGLHSSLWLLANAALGLGACLMLYALGKRLGFPATVATVAALLYATRDVTYTLAAWVCALGDNLVIFFGAVSIYCLLGSFHQRALRKAALYCAALAAFLLCLLSKQSSFALIPIFGLVFLLRPGDRTAPPPRTRILTAVLAVLISLAPALLVYLHAKSLTYGATPYPVGFALSQINFLLGCVTFYFVPLYLPPGPLAALAPVLVGLVLTALGVYLFRRTLQRASTQERTSLFFLAGAVPCSIGMFLLLPTRVATYYSCMAAFWACLLVARLLFPTNAPSLRSRRYATVLVLLTGVVFVQIKTTSLLPAGGYLWGTYGMDHENAEFHAIGNVLAQAGQPQTVVIATDLPTFVHANMVMLQAPTVQRIFLYHPATGEWLTNDQSGQVPPDTSSAWRDYKAFRWDQPTMQRPQNALWIQVENGRATAITQHP